MAILNNSNAIESGGYNLTRSLRFRQSASAYLNRTPASASNRKTWTWSAWVKRGNIISGDVLQLFAARTGSSASYSLFYFNDSSLAFLDNNNSTNVTSTSVYRDPSAWYHMVIAVDTTQATASNRVKMYVNGNQITTFNSAVYPNQNTDLNINSTADHYHCRQDANQYFDGYLTEINFIDGQALTPSSFGATDATTGVWQPKKYTGTYGTNGFYLPFTDNSALTTSSNVGLGKDFSGNSNYWTTNNISITSGTTYDSMTDVPTLTSATAANYATLNPNAKASSITLSEGNLKSVDASGSFTVCVFATQTVFDKCYWEFQITNVGVSNVRGACGVLPSNYTPTTFANDTLVAGVTALGANSVGMCPQVSAIYQNGATTGISTGVWVANDVVMIAYDNGKLWMGRNGTWANSGDPAAGTGYVASGLDTSALPVICNRNSQTWYANFGQRPFSYSVPSGFVALNTYNLPTPTILKGNTVMDATTYTGNGSTQSITNAAGFKPDLVWLKVRNQAYGHALFDSIRGVGNGLQSNNTNAEDAWGTSTLASFNTNGFGLGADTIYLIANSSGNTFVGWQWQAGQGSTSSNTSGSITSTVSVNASAGFSIVTYTGTGANATVGHGLGVAPKLIILKSRSSALLWPVWHTTLANTEYLTLNSTSAKTTASPTVWNSTSPTSSVFSIGTATGVNTNAATYVAYCWAEISGYSKAFSYTGNGSTDGVFTYLGFLPKLILIKRTDTTGNWYLWDTARNTYNVLGEELYPNLSNAGSTATDLDVLSNGFKLRNSTAGFNASGGTYIGFAWASNPFKNSLGY